MQENADVCRFGRHNQILAAALKSGSEAVGAALIDLGDDSSRLVCDTSRDVYDTNVPAGPVYESALGEMLSLLAENFQAMAKAE